MLKNKIEANLAVLLMNQIGNDSASMAWTTQQKNE